MKIESVHSSTSKLDNSSNKVRLLISESLPDISAEKIEDIFIVRLKNREHQALLEQKPGDKVCIFNVQHKRINSNLPEFQNNTIQHCVKIDVHGKNNGGNINNEPILSLESPIISLKLIDSQFNLSPTEALNLSRFGNNVKSIPNIEKNPLPFLIEKYKQSNGYAEEEIINLGFYIRIFEVLNILYL